MGVLKSKPAFKSSPLPSKAQLNINNQAHQPTNLHLLSAARPTTHKGQLHISSQAQQPPSPVNMSNQAHHPPRPAYTRKPGPLPTKPRSQAQNSNNFFYAHLLLQNLRWRFQGSLDPLDTFPFESQMPMLIFCFRI